MRFFQRLENGTSRETSARVSLRQRLQESRTGVHATVRAGDVIATRQNRTSAFARSRHRVTCRSFCDARLRLNRAERVRVVALPVAQALPPAIGPGWTSLDCSTGFDDRRAQQKPTSFPVGFVLLWTAMDFVGLSESVSLASIQKTPNSI
jgi:hypothetical protein